MNTLKTLSSVCYSFKEGKFSLEEFQSRLESLMISDEMKVNLEKVRFDAVNILEEIRFSSLESNFYKYGIEVADTVLEKINNIIVKMN